MSNPISSAFILYKPPVFAMEFIKTEVEKGLSNGSIMREQTYPASIPSSLPSVAMLNFDNISRIFSSLIEDTPPPISVSQPEALPRLRMSSMASELNAPLPRSHSQSTKPSRTISEILGSLNSDDFLLTNFNPLSASISHRLNGAEIAEALQAEAAFTTSTDKKPIVATYGAGPCVALGGYDATNKIAFVVHFSNAGEVRKSGGVIFYNIARLVKTKIEAPIQLHLRGGIKGQSEAIIKAIKIWMRQRDDLPMKIASQDILDSWMSFGGKSLSIDSRNGKVSDYDPMANPTHRELDDMTVMMAIMSAYEPNIKVAYRPGDS